MIYRVQFFINGSSDPSQSFKSDSHSIPIPPLSFRPFRGLVSEPEEGFIRFLPNTSGSSLPRITGGLLTGSSFLCLGSVFFNLTLPYSAFQVGKRLFFDFFLTLLGTALAVYHESPRIEAWNH